MTRYDIIFEALQERVELGELTVEQAEVLNDIAYDKYCESYEDEDMTYGEYLEAMEYELFEEANKPNAKAMVIGAAAIAGILGIGAAILMTHKKIKASKFISEESKEKIEEHEEEVKEAIQEIKEKQSKLKQLQNKAKQQAEKFKNRPKKFKNSELILTKIDNLEVDLDSLHAEILVIEDDIKNATNEIKKSRQFYVNIIDHERESYYRAWINGSIDKSTYDRATAELDRMKKPLV